MKQFARAELPSPTDRWLYFIFQHFKIKDQSTFCECEMASAVLKCLLQFKVGLAWNVSLQNDYFGVYEVHLSASTLKYSKLRRETACASCSINYPLFIHLTHATNSHIINTIKLTYLRTYLLTYLITYLPTY